MQAKMKEVAGLWLVADPDLQITKLRAAEADQIRSDIHDKAIDTRAAVLKVLTPDQRAACIKRCQSGQCGCGMCGMGCGNAAVTCPMGTGMGRGMGRGMGPTGTGCPLRR